jgi:hypothetical protein
VDANRIGHAGLVGWRARVGERAASVLARGTPISEETARAVVGFAFFALTLRSAAQMLARARRNA